MLRWGHVTALCPRPPFCPRLPPPCHCSRTALVSVRSPRHCPECPVRLGPLPSARSPVRTSLGCRHPQRRVQDKRGGSPVPSLGLPAPQLPSPESFMSALHAPPGASLCSPYSVLCNRAAGRGGRRVCLLRPLEAGVLAARHNRLFSQEHTPPRSGHRARCPPKQLCPVTEVVPSPALAPEWHSMRANDSR